MPFTPYHLGLGFLIGIVFFKFFDFLTFLFASMIVDLEPLSVILFRLHLPLHGFFHSFLGGSLVAVLLAIFMYAMKKPFARMLSVFKLSQKSSFKKILLTSFFGVYSHVLIDSFMHKGMEPFFPLEGNPFLGLFSLSQVTDFCLWSFLFGLLIYFLRFIFFSAKGR
ncbi:MAG: hypothetical protein COZ91_02835 [Candidatus Nealsonbacteria bacterium CG_4_8_14_3_um_filter_39_7]|uniref:Hydrolase n=1 Tax=Candidatus Nealsonbacteria bacterium CG23_combo_of_CG06-09_8_20_14_all_39_17 TaxID=1974722 RepID=A0A2G9YU84_9BACT|nr:MAG: hypothetical protein COX37_02430 [Candidatus Nealsonbacteria bacterium CG23_combo_of_CG06-09_8_20_14_all_39_17]PIU44064.1 MAG: hypothetical protein COS96_01035 [Candidatus Nealsonbacteria bacterium CG07_land_8_20_14_0_80_39_13]PIW90997.1 MAG: hypothetical protein COZ91_02835 [Candidatus Nealsonbacteria bacterium CG_4_8_14_3_um_filter_39_7]